MSRFYKILSKIKEIIAANLLFAILIAILSAVLIVRALPDNHMDMTSAQTILAARWWARDGFANNYFLQLINGYGKIVRYFEEPSLNEHAQGDVAGGLIGHKLYYSHYPSLYIIPVALLIKFGVNKLFFLRILSIIASVFSLIFLYAFIKLLINRFAAFVGTLYFAISPIFIKWADSLEYTAQEDFWRFLILLMSLITFNYFRNNGKEKNGYLYLTAIWLCDLFLALTSFNSTFFIFTWLVGLSAIYIYYRNYNKKRKIYFFAALIAIWASAPIFGFLIQLIQNVSYLGWHNTWLDIYGAFHYAGNRIGLDFTTRIEGLFKPFFSMIGIYNFYSLLVPFGIAKFKIFIFLIALIGTFAVIRLIKIAEYKVHSSKILILLAVAPLAQTFVMPYLGFRDSLGRLFAPFIGIAIGSIAWMLCESWRKKYLNFTNKILFLFITILILSLFAIQVALNFTSRFWPVYAPLSANDIAFAESMKKIAPGEKAAFMINEDDTKIPETELKKRLALYDPTHYQTNYLIWKYYFDIPLINFTKISYLVRDLLYLEKRSEFPFTAIVTSDDFNLISGLHKDLGDKSLELTKIEVSHNRYYFLVKK